jgi:hypothetical protein
MRSVLEWKDGRPFETWEYIDYSLNSDSAYRLARKAACNSTTWVSLVHLSPRLSASLSLSLYFPSRQQTIGLGNSNFSRTFRVIFCLMELTAS